MCASMRARYMAMLSIILGVLSPRGRLGAFGRARPSAARTTRFLWVLAGGACWRAERVGVLKRFRVGAYAV